MPCLASRSVAADLVASQSFRAFGNVSLRNGMALASKIGSSLPNWTIRSSAEVHLAALDRALRLRQLEQGLVRVQRDLELAAAALLDVVHELLDVLRVVVGVRIAGGHVPLLGGGTSGEPGDRGESGMTSVSNLNIPVVSLPARPCGLALRSL